MIGRLTDRCLLRVIRWCLHRLSDRAALDLFLIQLDYWAGPRGGRMFAVLQRGER